MKRRWAYTTLLRRYAGFFLVPLFGLLAPLFALPIIGSTHGAAGIASVAVGQALGAVAATVLELGWAWNGPMRIARAAPWRRSQELMIATRARVLVAVAVTPVVCAAGALIVGPHPITTALTGLGAALGGLSLTWYFVGIGRPWLIVVFDAAPRFLCVAVAAALIAAGAPLWIYPVIGLVFPSVSLPVVVLLAMSRSIGRTVPRMSIRRTWRVIRSQLKIVVARTVSGLYIQLPVVLIAAMTTTVGTAQFAAGDRLSKMALSSTAPLPNLFQNYVGRAASQGERATRARLAVVINAVIGMIIGAAFSILAPILSPSIFGGAVQVDQVSSVVLGALIAVVMSSRAVGGIQLVATRSDSRLLHATVAGAAVGLPAIITISLLFGPVPWAYAGMLLAEIVVIVIQMLPRRTEKLGGPRP